MTRTLSLAVAVASLQVACSSPSTQRTPRSPAGPSSISPEGTWDVEQATLYVNETSTEPYEDIAGVPLDATLEVRASLNGDLVFYDGDDSYAYSCTLDATEDPDVFQLTSRTLGIAMECFVSADTLDCVDDGRRDWSKEQDIDYPWWTLFARR